MWPLSCSSLPPARWRSSATAIGTASRTTKELAATGFNPPDTAHGRRTDLASFTVDWDALRAINPETIGWIYIPGTTINLPVVHTDDDVPYLKTDFYGETNWAVVRRHLPVCGKSAADFSDANNIVYGHHMNDGSMFSPIADFEDPTTFNACRTVIFTPSGNYRLTVQPGYCAADDPLAQTVFASEQERAAAYVQEQGRPFRRVRRGAALGCGYEPHVYARHLHDNSAQNGRWVLFAYVAGQTAGTSWARRRSQRINRGRGRRR